jgi:hypothetical protein
LVLQFNFKIIYHLGTAGGKPDILTSRSRALPKVLDNGSLKNQIIIIKPENILYLSAMAIFTLASPALVQLFTHGYNEDPFPNKILKLIEGSTKYCCEISLTECDEQNNLLYYCHRIWFHITNY